MEEMKKTLNNILSFFVKGPCPPAGAAIGIYLLVFLTPFNPRLMGFGVAIMIVEQIIRLKPIRRSHIKESLHWKNPIIWLFLFYIMHVVGTLYSENMSFAELDLGMKASFAIFPLFFLLYKIEINWKWMVWSFLIGVFLSIVINFSWSFLIYLEEGSTYYLMNSELSHFMHRSYWAVYLSIGYFFLVRLILQNKLVKTLTLYLLGAFSIALIIVLTGAKIAYILLFLITIWGGVMIFKQQKNKWVVPGVLLALTISILTIFYVSPRLSGRIDQAFDAVSRPIDSYDKVHPHSTTARIMAWDAALVIIKENFWWGVGTGDVKDELIKEYDSKGCVGIAKKKLNSHNQFLNTHVTIGIFGVLFLFLSLFMNGVKKKNDHFYKWRRGIIVILFLALLPEAMLETQAGIIPYALFICMLPIVKKDYNCSDLPT